MTALLIAALLAFGDPATPELAEPVVEAAPPVEAPVLAFRGHLAWITAAGAASSRGSPVNPGNRVLQVPAGGGQTELRPDLRLEYGTALTAIARPRFFSESLSPLSASSPGSRRRVRRSHGASPAPSPASPSSAASIWR